jgi:hypothetical protein
VARNTFWFFQSVSPDVFGGTPNTAGQRPALPIPTASLRLRDTGDAKTDYYRHLEQIQKFYSRQKAQKPQNCVYFVLFAPLCGYSSIETALGRPEQRRNIDGTFFEAPVVAGSAIILPVPAFEVG